MSLGEQTLQTSAQSSQRKEASVLKDIQPCPARTEAAEPHGPAECPGTQKLTAAGLCQFPTGPAEHACVNNTLHSPGCAHRGSNYYMQTKIICIYTPQGTLEKLSAPVPKATGEPLGAPASGNPRAGLQPRKNDSVSK